MVLSVFLFACGQKGALYLENDASNQMPKQQKQAQDSQSK